MCLNIIFFALLWNKLDAKNPKSLFTLTTCADTSYSMDLMNMKDFLHDFVTEVYTQTANLEGKPYSALISFADKAEVVLQPTFDEDKFYDKLKSLDLKSSDKTYLESCLRKVKDITDKRFGKHLVVIVTDSKIADASASGNLIQTLREKGLIVYIPEDESEKQTSNTVIRNLNLGIQTINFQDTGNIYWVVQDLLQKVLEVKNVCIGKPAKVEFGNFPDDCITKGHDFKCPLTCIKNYMSVGTGKSACENDGNWTHNSFCVSQCNQPPMCITKCDYNPEIFRSNAHLCKNTPVGKPCSGYKCFEGYVPDKLLQCMSGGIFSDSSCVSGCSAPPKKSVENSDPHSVEHCSAQVGKICNFSCKPGYARTENFVCTVPPRGWSGTGKCSRCDKFPPTKFGVDPKSIKGCINKDIDYVCPYKCNEPLVTNGILKCDPVTGTWTTSWGCQHGCRSKPSLPENAEPGSVDKCVNALPKTKCDYTCKPDNVKNKIMLCLSLSQPKWDTGSKCVAGCPNQPPLVVNSVAVTVSACAGLEKNKECVYKCKDNFVRNKKKLVCDSPDWSKGSACIAGCSIPLPNFKNLDISSGKACAGTPNNGFCDYMCVAGSIPNGRAQCAMSKWNVPMTGCIPGCTAAPSKFFGVDPASLTKANSCFNGNIGAICNFACLTNYKKSGSISCGRTQPNVPTWIISNAKCDFTGCKDRPPARQWKYKKDCTLIPIGGHCPYDCPSPLHQFGHNTCASKDGWKLAGVCDFACTKQPNVKNADPKSLEHCGFIQNGLYCATSCKSGYHRYGTDPVCVKTEWDSSHTFCVDNEPRKDGFIYGFLGVAAVSVLTGVSAYGVSAKYLDIPENEDLDIDEFPELDEGTEVKANETEIYIAGDYESN
ncbi:hypothetical protein MHBO_000470 [Bonamia ostreae]|uniref:Sushi domain-containing protein n=1 Tax=Bonamia ostreae TaxID=126728 RepID=A0ABV2AFS7_9EUKA